MQPLEVDRQELCHTKTR